jgi:hypothetical protein
MNKWKYILHVLNTWVVANLFNPLFIYMRIGTMNGEWLYDSPVSFYFLGLIVSFLFSIPFLIAAWIVFYFIRKSQIPAPAKFGSWLFIVSALPVIAGLLLWMAAGVNQNWKEEFDILFPSSLSAVVAILIRVKHFLNHFHPVIKEENNG